MADAAELELGGPASEPLKNAAGRVEPFGSGGLDLFNAERAILKSLELSVLFRRERSYVRSDRVRDIVLSPDGTVVLESSWRRPSQ